MATADEDDVEMADPVVEDDHLAGGGSARRRRGDGHAGDDDVKAEDDLGASRHDDDDEDEEDEEDEEEEANVDEDDEDEDEDEDDEDEDDEEEEEEEDGEDASTRKRKRRKDKQGDDNFTKLVFGGDLRQVVADHIEFSRSDCAHRLKRSADGLSVSGYKGFRSCRVNFGVLSGHWFCEMRIEEMKASADVKVAGHVRLGWSQYSSPIEAPVGFHKSGFGYRDVDGSKVNDALREPYGDAGFVEGDVIGLEINVDVEDTSASFIRFYRNGEDQGVAFRGMLPDKIGFFATVSLYQSARVALVPGPAFSTSNALPQGARPLCELAATRLPPRLATPPPSSEIAAAPAATKQQDT
ncbi:Set1/Ash2 histone methyltransferase complex subunit ASH2 [Hondaea fermentalgiana]|uniref:Set1/Ash2 histone methyltransferase complex subunit ASH2 n=1 Tax=Hondaea fermentalgiana TaxID=2315210 RepID=A0A2R5GTY0_9STRA|nr:Set1/Ash2 histone methyltransferase complex subunit ASH2 [Hondaea fermentalgiana]|eukprot:GBG34025.1 Set1/Ash2 histone methyltransferase complex subunit ASH2 [Hondaea fermentalgiana]